MGIFIPPINGGVFKPSSADIASWLYQIWSYLQENPIANETELTALIEQTMPEAVAAYLAEHPVEVDYPVDSVNGKTGAVTIDYAELVNGTTVPVYRAANDEVGPTDLLDAYNEGCRFAVVDDTNTFVLLKNGNTIIMLPIGGGGSSGGGDGIQSINGSIYPDGNGNAIITGSNLPMSSSDTTTLKTAIDAKTTLTAVVNAVYPVGSVYISTASTAPSTLFPGTTWQAIEDRFLLAAGSAYSAGATGGEATHTLTIAEMPSHSHTLSFRDSYLNSGSNRKAPADQYNDSYMSTSSVGGGQAHNNMPPYIVVYMWKRVS